MALLSKAFHSRQASEYHTTLCLESGNKAVIVFFPTDNTNWWCQKSSVGCTVLTCSRQNLQNINKEDLAKSTGVVPAKYPPKVKLERISTTLECQSWENYAYLGLWGLWGFYSKVKLTFASWRRGSFLVGKILINTRILWDPFLVGIPLIGVGHGTQVISMHKHSWGSR